MLNNQYQYLNFLCEKVEKVIYLKDFFKYNIIVCNVKIMMFDMKFPY
jgi:hypothetical protein